MHKSRIVIIAAGSFQGKSLIALEIACRLKFSGVVTTDLIRNVLKTIRPDEDYLSTSTYSLPHSLLLKQMHDVSNIIKQLIAIYKDRGEHIVVEGMHFTEDFIKWVSTEGFFTICLNNRLPFPKRIILKGITRSCFSLYDPRKEKKVSGTIDDTNVNNSIYMKYQARFDYIHRSLINCCMQHGFQLIEFENLKDGIDIAVDSVQKWITNKQE